MTYRCGSKKLIIAGPCVLWMLLGCSGIGTQENSAAGSGGADGGRICTWDGTGGGVSLPDCSPYRDTAYFVGTIDGEYYDHLWTNNPTAIGMDSGSPIILTIGLPSNGKLQLEWPRSSDIEGQFIGVTGTMLLPLDMAPREVKPGSLLRRKCATGMYQYILTLDGGNLNGCSVN